MCLVVPLFLQQRVLKRRVAACLSNCGNFIGMYSMCCIFSIFAILWSIIHKEVVMCSAWIGSEHCLVFFSLSRSILHRVCKGTTQTGDNFKGKPHLASGET